jgi:hypothetical protein
LVTYLEEAGELCHYGRLAVVSWMIGCGFTDEEIHSVFRYAKNYKPHITQCYIDDVRKFLEEGGKPMRCVTVIERCNGHNMPSIDCNRKGQ